MFLFEIESHFTSCTSRASVAWHPGGSNRGRRGAWHQGVGTCVSRAHSPNDFSVEVRNPAGECVATFAGHTGFLRSGNYRIPIATCVASMGRDRVDPAADHGIAIMLNRHQGSRGFHTWTPRAVDSFTWFHKMKRDGTHPFMLS